MDIFLICMIVLGCGVLLSLFGAATKAKGDGCLPLVFLGLIGLFGIIVLALLD